MKATRRIVGVIGLMGLAIESLGCGEVPEGKGHVEHVEHVENVAPRRVRVQAESMSRLGIRVAPFGEQDVVPELRVPGTLEYDLDRFAEVGTLLSGRVASVRVRVGDRVRKGAELGTVVVPSLAEAQAELVSRRAAALAARRNLTREEELASRRLTTAREHELAQSEAARADADLAAVESKLRALRVAAPKEGASVAGSGLFRLVAPIDGVVVKRHVILGGFLDANQTAFAVADPSELWATVDVFESDLPYFRLGADVTLTVDAMPGKEFHGKVSLVEPQVGSASRALRARIAIPNAEQKLRAGLFVRASIRLAPEGASLAIPIAAVQPSGDNDVVFVEHEPGVFEMRTVQLKRRTPQIAEIESGLSMGERIAVDGAFLLRAEASRQ